MFIIALNHPYQLEYLRGIFNEHIAGGINAEDLPLAADTYVALQSAREIPAEPSLGKADVVEAGPKGIALEIPNPALRGRRPIPPMPEDH